MDLKSASQKAYEIAQKRGQYKKDGQDVLRGLKHCAGEVLEAVESYTKYVYSPKEEEAYNFPAELADIIMCVLSICGAENIDIENAMWRCFIKNAERAEGGKK